MTTTNQEEFYFYNTADISLKIEGGFNPKGLFCDIGVNSITINNLGVVSRCTSCAKQSIIGNIIENKIKVLENGFFCPNNTCSCNYYGVIKNIKYFNNNETEK